MLTTDVCTLIVYVYVPKKPKLYTHFRLDAVVCTAHCESTCVSNYVKGHTHIRDDTGELLMVESKSKLYDAADYYIADNRRAALDWYLTEMPYNRDVITMAIKYDNIKTLSWLMRVKDCKFKKEHAEYSITHNKINTMKYILACNEIKQWFVDRAAAYGRLEILKWIYLYKPIMINLRTLGFAQRMGHTEVMEWVNSVI